jgi:Helix-turn-helix domain
MSSTQLVAAQPISRGVTVREFAELNSMSIAGIQRQIREGFIPCYRIGKSVRIPLSFLEQLQQQQRRPNLAQQQQQPDPLEAAIDKLVATAPKLTADQRSRISALLRVGARANGTA